MDALILTMFVSLVLAAGGVGMFIWLAGARTFDHADRLALLPMDDDDEKKSAAEAKERGSR